MKKFFILLPILAFFLAPILAHAKGDLYYVTQNGSGAGSGLSLSKAWSVSDFNDSSNWSSSASASKIDPGDTVYFSGRITSQINPAGSGKAGNYVTLDGASATVEISANSLDYTSGSINIEAESYLTIQNFTIDGLTQPVNASTGRAGIWMEGYEDKPSNYIVIVDCEISNHSSGIRAYDNVHYVTVQRSYVHDVGGNGFGATFYHKWGKPSNMTIGGAPGQGNVFKNCGYNDDRSRSGSSPDIELAQTNDTVISYNHVYADKAYHGMGGIMIQEAERILIEYNTVHGHYSVNNRGGIVIKEDHPTPFNEDIIIRYNHVYDELQEGKPAAWGREKAGIHAGSDVHNIFIYGNYVHDTHWGIRLMENFSKPDGRNNENFYVFSNIVANTEEQGIALNGTQDAFIGVYLFNNTIYHSSYSSTFVTGIEKTAIANRGMSAGQLKNIYIKNNVLVNSRPNKSDHIGIYWLVDDALYIGHNHHYNIGGTPTVYYDKSSCTNCAWDSSKRPTGYGNNDTGGDPLLSDTKNGDFSIASSSSPLVDSGIEMGTGVIATITIQGTAYPVRWDTSLDPHNTNWSTVPPTVSVLQQGDFGSWEKGAYIYGEIFGKPVSASTPAPPDPIWVVK